MSHQCMLEIITSDRIDYCGTCKKEHGYDCPKDKKNKLLVLKGLPASGKSTIARELVDKGWKRVNKDDLRAMIDNSKHSKGKENIIKNCEKFMAAHFLTLNYNVVVDDTNFGYEDYWKEVAESAGADFEIQLVDTPLMVCIERDSKRGDKSVGTKVIFNMYNKFLKPKAPEYSDDKQNCYVWDIDGTLALMNGRSPYDYTQVSTDIPNHNITMIARLIAQSGLPMILVSGREDFCMQETMDWLKNNSIPFNALYMRKSGDYRNDSEIKKEIYETILKPKYNVLAVFDDRNRVVDMWRSLGLTTLQVAYGYF